MTSFQLIEADDLAAVAAAMDRNAPGTGTRLLRRARWLLVDNPWRGERPLGVRFLADGEVAGYCFGIAQPMWVAGEARPGWFGMGLHLAEAWRGTMVGTSLYQAFFRLGGDAVGATTTGNATSNAVWGRLGARALPGGDRSLVLPLRPWRLAPAWVARRLGEGGAPRVESGWRPRRVRPRRSRGFRTGVAAELSDLAALWRDVRSGFGLATDRTEGWLRWRYGLGAPPSRLIAVRDRAGGLRAFYAFRLARRGGRAGVWTSLLLDLVAAPDDTDALRAAGRDFVVRSAAQGAHLVEIRALHPALRAALAAPWFRPRPLPSNGYLARAAAEALPDPSTWHLVPADGDAGFW